MGLERSSRVARTVSPWADRYATIAFLTLAFGLLYVAGRPLFTDDSWWHLSLGRAFANAGPWLETAPALHTSAAPPAPAAWLSDLLLYAVARTFGLEGLRILHVVVVAGILAAAWRSLRRASDTAGIASFAAALFLVFSAYRLVQLRPELATISATLVLYLVLLQRREVPSWGRVGFAVFVCGLWANLHPAFPLGPVLIAGASAGLLLERALKGRRAEPVLRARAWRLGCAAVLGSFASFLNPLGGGAHLLYFQAGEAAPAMTFVADEWAPLDPFRLPLANLPPDLLSWIGYWVLGLATLTVVTMGIRRWRGEDVRPAMADLDGALLPLAMLGLLAPLVAVRFLWLSFFPLLVLANAVRGTGGVQDASRRVKWVAASLSVLLVPTFHQVGEWPLLSNGISRVTYADTYDRWKYYGHATRFLVESSLEGNLYHSYFMGGFLGYWLAPRLRVFIDGSLQVPPQVMTDYLALQRNESGPEGSNVGALLDRYEVDVYVGIGFPTPPLANRPYRHTARHLENSPDWTLVFRNMDSAVFLRRNERNRRNIERAADYYAGAGIKFDPETGVEVEKILDEAPDWASQHGLVPREFERLVESWEKYGTQDSIAGLIASAYLALGLDERALAIDEELMRRMPTASSPRRRRLGALLRLGRVEQALEEAEELDSLQPGDPLSRALVAAARRYVELDRNQRMASASRLPVLTHSEARRLGSLQVPPVHLSSLIQSE